MASKAVRLRKAYEFKLGKDLAANLTDSQIKIISAYYNSLSESEQSDIDNKIAMGMSNDLSDMAYTMLEENNQSDKPEESPPEGPPEDELEPESPGVITLYEGVRETDLVDEDISETILRALGLEDVFDIDYGTYRTLLKERMMADRMGQPMDSSEAEAVTEEFKRVKGKVGRFRIKVRSGEISSPVGGGAGSGGMKNFLALKGPDTPAPEETPEAESSDQKFNKINSILDEILSTIKNSFKFDRSSDKKKKQQQDRDRKQSREDKLEKGSGAAKVLTGIGAAILKPLQGPLDYLLNFIKYTFLAKVVKNLFTWFSDPQNQKKLSSVFRFLKDWWPAMVAAYLIFGNGLSRGILKLTAILVKGAARLLKVALPKLMSLIARNPKAAAATALFTAGATVPLLFPNTVNEQERKIEAKPGTDADKIEALKEQKQNLNPLQNLQGVGPEIDEQISKLETGETKSYNSGGAVKSESKESPNKLNPDNFLPFLAPLLGPAAPMLMPFMADGIGEKIKENPMMLAAMGPAALPFMMMQKDKISTASNQQKDPARDITTNSGTDVTGAGVDTQLVPANPGDIVMNKETVDAVGPRTFDTIAANSGAKITGAGPDTQMIAARPGEVIINKETVNRVGAGHFLGMNKKYGGSNANKPKTAKVQSAMGGGFVLPTFQGGGMVGGPSMMELPSTDTPAAEPSEDYKNEGNSPANTENKRLLKKRTEQQGIMSTGGNGSTAKGSTASNPTREGSSAEYSAPKGAEGEINPPSTSGSTINLLGPGGSTLNILGSGGVTINSTDASGKVSPTRTGGGGINPPRTAGYSAPKGGKSTGSGGTNPLGIGGGTGYSAPLGASKSNGSITSSSTTTNINSSDSLESLSIEQLRQKLDPTITGASNPAVFKAARAAREEAKASGMPKEEIEKRVLIATIRASNNQTSGSKPTPAAGASPSSSMISMSNNIMNPPNTAGYSAPKGGMAGRSPTQGKPPAGPAQKQGGFFSAVSNVIKTLLPGALPAVNMIGGAASNISKAFGGGEVKENSGMDISGATADRQHIDVQPGEYVVPEKSTTEIGPDNLDKMVAQTDKNSTPAKLMPSSKKKPVPGPPVPEGTASMQTLPAITGGSAGGGDSTTAGKARNVPTFSATSPYAGDRQNNADIYGIR